ncbi:hypothetical protein [Zhouia amylolytica]|uniref:Uncharacterized protein n=1 Tax=Zhouia amylolytica AD3 TaxID=1286632 RepID=W2UJ79_9FLAO|nr:hypothetical protein [Zhouia amylolytica]ETN94004.1 hypothetical protein P278_28080 [Zhouia amylolytica AD3]
MQFDINTRYGIIGGTLFSVLPLYGLEALWETAITAAIGASISFFMSILLKKVREWWS